MTIAISGPQVVNSPYQPTGACTSPGQLRGWKLIDGPTGNNLTGPSLVTDDRRGTRG